MQKIQQAHNNELIKIAVVGMGCHYPGAEGLQSLWENVLSRRRQFRRLPAERLPLSEYYSPDLTVADKTYGSRAAVIDGFEFDWASWRIPKTTFETTDIVHWLALKTAHEALQDTGWNLKSLPNEKTGVIVGNTLTGEYTRANTLRTRWPYVRRAFLATAEASGLPSAVTQALLETFEATYKSPFAAVTEDSLAGGLSNTIAGRICNAFNLDGGGYTVDGACASSLIAVKTAAAALATGELDCALAGGVDVSLDPMELVGFAKTGALTATDMTVYDRLADGFIPGEGCGFVVLKRLTDAQAQGDYVYATVTGWGISSDGRGGITAPSSEGQAKALRRAYKASDSGDLPDFIEGHGTGTAVGDRAELAGIAAAFKNGEADHNRPIGITSFKSIVGHTKAAAGIGGFIKAVMAVNQRIIPPTAGCKTPSATFESVASSVYPVLTGEIRPAGDRLKAGVSAMGFGGINSHVVLTSADEPASHLRSSLPARALLVSHQETELIILSATSVATLLTNVQTVRQCISGISVAELTDYAAHLTQSIQPAHPLKAALVTDSLENLGIQLQQLEAMLESGLALGESRAIAHQGIWVSNAASPARIGFLFPGQGSQRLNMARTLVERYDWARALVARADDICQQTGGHTVSPLLYRSVERAAGPEVVEIWKKGLAETHVAQPAICLVSLLWCEYLKRLGIQATAIGGHSLGELSAFQAAGAMDAERLLRLATVRGQIMAQSSADAGTMVSLSCEAATAQRLIDAVEGIAVIANRNSPQQTVVSGDPMAMAAVVHRAIAQGIQTRQLPVSNAFHSPLMAKAAAAMKSDAVAVLEAAAAPLTSALFSIVDGAQVQPDLNLQHHFARAITAPVDFVTTVRAMAEQCDLFIEVGPGRVLSGLVSDIIPDGPICLPLEAKAQSDRTLNAAIAHVFTQGNAINWNVLYENRLVRPFVPAAERRFITNPCERPLTVPAAASLASLMTEPAHSNGAAASNGNTAQPADWAAQLGQYFSQRGEFIAQVIRADLETLPSTTAPAIPAVGTNGNGPLISNGSFANGLPPEQKAKTNGHRQNAEPILAQPVQSQPTPKLSIQAELEQALIHLIVERTGYAADTIQPELRLLDDLNLDSIKATEIVVTIAGQYGVVEQLDPSVLANATLRAVAAAIKALVPSVQKVQSSGSEPVAASDEITNSLHRKIAPSWVRNFAIKYVPQTLLASKQASKQAEVWAQSRVLIVADTLTNRPSELITQQLTGLGAQVERVTYSEIGDSVFSATHYVAVLPQRAAAETLPLAEMVARLSSLVAPASGNACVAYVQFGGGRFGDQGNAHPAVCCAAAFARSLHLERPTLRLRVIDCDPKALPEKIAAQVIAELPGESAMSSAGYAADEVRRVPQSYLQQPQQYPMRSHSWSAQDVILTTGGAKGITAECALAFAQRTGVKMALVGRSPAPAVGDSGEIAHTLARYQSAQQVCRYYACDITDANAVAELVKTVQAELGPITGVIHGAGLNHPQRVERVAPAKVVEEVSPKLLGAINLMQALSAAPPQLFAAFSSIIGVTGMQGNAWYGFANEALDITLRRFRQQYPAMQTVAIAYSVWGEVGMGARMGSVQQLAKMGISAIPTAAGVSRFLQLMQCDPQVAQVLIAARLDGLDTWPCPLLPSPNFRFVEQVQRVEPQVELVARSHLSLERDRYIQDHLWRGSYLFPTVFGLEAMAQAAAYVMENPELPICQIEDISLLRPIVVDPTRGADIELHATVAELDASGQQRIHVGIRTAQTGFASDHFSATLVVGELPPGAKVLPVLKKPINANPKADLYGGLLFQGERFQKIEQIVSLDDRVAVFRSQVQTRSAATQASFADETSPLLLGDPYCRDSLLQSLQLTIPQDICLPIQIDKLERFQSVEGSDSSEGRLRQRIGTARLLQRQDQEYLGEIVATDQSGAMTERLSGYRLRILETHPENPTALELALQLSSLSNVPSLDLLVDLPVVTPTANGSAAQSTRSAAIPVANQSAHSARYSQDGPQGQLVYEQRFQVSFKESGSLSRRVYFSQYFRWVGKIRELPMESIAKQIMADFLTGEWGMVTNAVSLRVLGEATAYDTVCARAWIGRVEGSSFTTYIEFCRVLSDPGVEERLERLAIAEVRATWVQLVSYGVPAPKPFPPYLESYIAQFTADHPADLDLRQPQSLLLPAVPSSLLGLSLGKPLSNRISADSRYGHLLRTETFQTTLEESNLVGNVYYGNYFIWQGRVLDLFLYSVAPEYLRVSTSAGEMICLYSRMDYLREAMPFDRIRTQLYVESVLECGATFRFEFFREQPDGSLEKLHVGEQEVAWIERGPRGEPTATSWPTSVRQALAGSTASV